MHGFGLGVGVLGAGANRKGPGWIAGRISPQALLEQAADGFFTLPPRGHFWLEHLVRALARGAPGGSEWRLFAATARGPDPPDAERAAAAYAVNHTTGYGMFHATEPGAGAELLAWALREAPPRKVLAPYDPLTQSLERAGLTGRVVRDHRELYLRLPLGGLAVEPDGNYRLARESDIPRLDEYNRLYNRERRTAWSRDWRDAVAAGAVYVREQGGVIASCLIRGAIMPPLASFGGTFTFPEFRGRGEATMLVANFCAEMGILGLEVCLLVDDDNEPAIRAYEKVGFVHEGYFRTVYF